MLGTSRARRFTQDSLVLPDVWIEFAKGTGAEAGDKPLPSVKLLLTPLPRDDRRRK